MADLSTKAVKVGSSSTKKSKGRATGGFAGRTKAGGGMGRMALAIPGMAEAAKAYGKGGGGFTAQMGEGAGATKGPKSNPSTGGLPPGQVPKGGGGPVVVNPNYDIGAGGPTSNPGQAVGRTNLPGNQGVGGTKQPVKMPITNAAGGLGPVTTPSASGSAGPKGITKEKTTPGPAAGTPVANATPKVTAKAPTTPAKTVAKAPAPATKVPAPPKPYASAPKTEGTAVRAQPLTKAPTGGVKSTTGASVARRMR